MSSAAPQPVSLSRDHPAPPPSAPNPGTGRRFPLVEDPPTTRHAAYTDGAPQQPPQPVPPVAFREQAVVESYGSSIPAASLPDRPGVVQQPTNSPQHATLFTQVDRPEPSTIYGQNARGAPEQAIHAREADFTVPSAHPQHSKGPPGTQPSYSTKGTSDLRNMDAQAQSRSTPMSAPATATHFSIPSAGELVEPFYHTHYSLNNQSNALRVQ